MNPGKPISECKAISFDLDDTLWECGPVITQAENVLQAWLKENTPRISAAHTTESLLEHRLASYQKRPDLNGDLTLLRTWSLEQLMLEFDYPEDLGRQAFAVFYKARSDLVLYDGVVDMLERLKVRFKLAAITNGNADLKLVGIDHYFDDIQSASINNAPKPETDMFDACLARLSIDAGDLLHVGDSPTTDVCGAHNAGVASVWFNQNGAQWPTSLPRPNYEVGSIAALVQLLTNY